jgi:hypothetical protein
MQAKLTVHRSYILNYGVFYYGLLLSYYCNYRLLSQYKPIYFSYNRDVVELLLIAIGIPKLLIANPSLYWVLDVIAFAFPLLLFAINYCCKKILLAVGILFSLYLFGYLLLHNLFEQMHLEMTVGYLLLSACLYLPFKNLHVPITLSRLLFLYSIFSAALWKIMRGSIFYPLQMKQILMQQHTLLLSSHCNDVMCTFYQYLIHHPLLAQLLYITATLLELLFILGWFTKKFDLYLLLLAMLFFIADYFLMKINYWPIMIAAITLMERKSQRKRNL